MDAMPDDRAKLNAALETRFGDAPVANWPGDGLAVLARMAGRASCRRFADRPVDPELIRLLCAVALSAPSKSDLQQRDIVIIEDPATRRRLDALVGGQPWIAGAPAFLMLCANNRRQRQLHAWHGRPFANDHLDAFFNAAVDAAIALSAFVFAAEAVGLGCCPVSTVRNRASEMSELLGLPDHVFPVAGLGVGWPAGQDVISPRLPLSVTVHVDCFGESQAKERIEDYDRRRAGLQPSAGGEVWSEAKARQYTNPQRADFGAFVRGKGFNLS